ncbi:MAG TPA: helix-turn-helix domain-containing protein [Methylotenera sp.]|nr:helix-turn-helix domain-containing protein [Methylotenera sp.]
MAPLTKTDVEQTQRLIRYLGTYMSESADKNPLKVKQVAHMSRSWTITSLAAEILTSWPNAFHSSLTKIQSRSVAEDKPTFNKVFGHAYHYLYRGLTGSAFEEIRNAFEIWLSHSWRGGLAKRNKRLTALVVDRATWIPGNLACDILGISSQRLKFLIREGAIEGECYITEKEREHIMVRRESLEIVKQNLSGEIDMTTARTLLGLGKKRTQQLLRLIFPEARKSGTSSSSPWTVSRFDVNKLLEINAKTPKVCIPDEDCVSLGHILRYWAWTAKDIANLVNAIRTEELIPVNVLEGVAGIGAWVFPEKVLKAWREASLQGFGTWLTITQAAKMIGMHEQSAYDAVKLNLLNSELLHRQPRGGKRIRRTEVDRFKSTYILASELAHRLGVSPRKAIHILAEQSITPVSGPLIDQGRQVIFLRTSAIEQLILEAKNQESLPMQLRSRP